MRGAGITEWPLIRSQIPTENLFPCQTLVACLVLSHGAQKQQVSAGRPPCGSCPHAFLRPDIGQCRTPPRPVALSLGPAFGIFLHVWRPSRGRHRGMRAGPGVWAVVGVSRRSFLSPPGAWTGWRSLPFTAPSVHCHSAADLHRVSLCLLLARPPAVCVCVCVCVWRGMTWPNPSCSKP